MHEDQSVTWIYREVKISLDVDVANLEQQLTTGDIDADDCRKFFQLLERRETVPKMVSVSAAGRL